MKFTGSYVALATLAVVVGCSVPTRPAGQVSTELKDAGGKTVGHARLRETSRGVLVNLDVNGIEPGLHAVHVHAVGRCEPPAFTSAGGHFNPAQKKHGFKSPEGPHAGDMPNMYVAKDGTGRFEVLVDHFTLAGGAGSLLDGDGSAVVIHAGIDDYVTDPAGNAGDRIACGVIADLKK